jgi:hypothetical protein
MTTVTMPSSDVTITASYVEIPIFATFRADGTNQFNGRLMFTSLNPDPMIIDWGDGSIPESFYGDVKKGGEYGYLISHDYTGINQDCDIRISFSSLTECKVVFIDGEVITFPGLSSLTSLMILFIGSPFLTTLPGLSNLTELRFLAVSGILITTPPDLTNLTKLTYLVLTYTSITTPPDLTGLVVLEAVILNDNVELDTADVDIILGYFSVLYTGLQTVNILNTAIPTPSVLLAAQTANPQCNFSVDQ